MVNEKRKNMWFANIKTNHLLVDTTIKTLTNYKMLFHIVI